MTKDEALKLAIETLEDIAFEYGNLLDGDQEYGLLPSETNVDIVFAYRTKRLCEEALKQQDCEECKRLIADNETLIKINNELATELTQQNKGVNDE